MDDNEDPENVGGAATEEYDDIDQVDTEEPDDKPNNEEILCNLVLASQLHSSQNFVANL